MRILLRNKGNGLYLKAPGIWTSHLDWAFDFKFIDRAITYAEAWRLEDVELAFVWDDSLNVQFMPLERAALQCAA